MSTIKSENWDSVTAPAIPSGWTVDTPIKTAATNPVSSPNTLALLTANLTATVPHATWATLDGNTGNVQVSTTIYLAATAAVDQEVWLFARASAVLANSNFAAASNYNFIVERSSATPGLAIQKRVSGSLSTIAGPIGTLADATYYILYFLCNGTSLKARCQRVSDSKWMNSSGTFVTDATGATYLFDITDTSVTGAGYAGIGFYGDPGAGSIYTDDFLLETPPVIGGGGGGTGTVTNYGNITGNPNIKVTPGDGVIRP